MMLTRLGPSGLILLLRATHPDLTVGLLHGGASRLNYPVATAPGTDSITLSRGLLQFAIALLHFDVVSAYFGNCETDQWAKMIT